MTTAMMTREFKWDEELDEVLEDLSPVERREWRHGHRSAFVFERDGAHWMVWIDVHHEDGWQHTDTITGTKVFPKEVKTIKWLPVLNEGTAGAEGEKR